jgi:hypothetical protein
MHTHAAITKSAKKSKGAWSARAVVAAWRGAMRV